ncbi:MAG: hypothetical protein C5B50_02330 [Verrucomicrobia bacterium]|nr:MAG: hypothetical protein C5B50_02330 [Verrucomicrobiota bacterium]
MKSFILILLFPVTAATHLPARTNQLDQTTNSASPVPSSNEAIELEYAKVMEADDAAQTEVDQWIRDNEEFVAKGAGLSKAQMKQRVKERLESVRKLYEDFLLRHPKHAQAHIAFGSFLNDLEEESAARKEWETAVELNPKNPAPYNNLANLFAETGPITNAFTYYAKASELNPNEPLYYHNLATAVHVYRKDAMQFYHMAEQQVFAKTLELYNKALKLDPTNFPLATDLAQTYYFLKPLRADEALQAWTNSLRIAHDAVEREGVYLHMARVKLAAGRFAEARAQTIAVTNPMYADLRKTLMGNIDKQEAEAKTNAAPANPKLEVRNPNESKRTDSQTERQ